jgi:uncharacterized protein
VTNYAPLDIPEDGKLAQNIAHFARALRKAGLPIGPGRTLDAVKAVAAAGFDRREDFYFTLQAIFVSRPEERSIFAQVFRLFWRDPRYLEHMMSLMLPQVRGVQEDRIAEAAEKRAAEALLDGQLPPAPKDAPEADQIEIDASATMSSEERLKTLDFEQMSTEEVAAAKRMLARLSLPVQPLKTRRSQPSTLTARIDARRTLRALPIRPRSPAGRTSSSFATSPAAWPITPGWSCISSTLSPTAKARAGQKSTLSPLARS